MINMNNMKNMKKICLFMFVITIHKGWLCLCLFEERREQVKGREGKGALNQKKTLLNFNIPNEFVPKGLGLPKLLVSLLQYHVSNLF